MYQSIFSICINIDTQNLKLSLQNKNIKTGNIDLFYIYKNEVKNIGNKIQGIYVEAAMLYVNHKDLTLKGNYFTSKPGIGHFTLKRYENPY